MLGVRSAGSSLAERSNTEKKGEHTMPKHVCECFDFPIKNGPINYTVTKKISKKGGGTWQIAVQEAIDEAKQQAQDDGEKAMKKEECDDPCERFIYVEPSLDKIVPT